jgi:hypothetical protein
LTQQRERRHHQEERQDLARTSFPTLTIFWPLYAIPHAYTNNNNTQRPE